MTAPDPDAPPPPAIPSTAEDRKTAAALSSLEDHHDHEDTQSKKIDQSALGDAISRLELVDQANNKAPSGGEKAEGKPSEAMLKRAKEKEAAEEEKRRRAKVKVDAADVGLLVEELDLTKPKATDLLKTHNGDLGKALMAFVTAVPV